MIVAAGLTPAWQQIVLLDTLRPGEVNRAREVHWCASGKVLNVALALRHLGAEVQTVALAGGANGEAILREFGQAGIAARWVETAAPTRVCTTILDTANQTTTELVENSPAVTPEELAAFQGAYLEAAQSAHYVVLSGSLPRQTPADYYRQLLRVTPGNAILDVRGRELLEALNERPFLVKPNREELAATVGRELRDDNDLLAAMRELNERGAKWVLITQGKQAVHLASRDAAYCLAPPPVSQVVNPIGCGDCLAAGVAWALERGAEPVEAVKIGMAAAADNLGQLLPARLDLKRVEGVAQSIVVRQI
ncbi:MAG: 1-phosphofructokinase family hexose kinase [Pedosphaera parvula]|nr:1-phosphofructokinase family hexose kinase [Pedosphaera parvula]